ncbi:uncharacterized protein LOC129738469 [Uranotaenia lowii]|uniref:uncharacterized protein LOC129738469 n=1 Tax=Uranotaenia lowii TaxID=190385 RepID=UPI0024785131|nr:uncharacterized protein LOC129738469 [Uranotaenia lowii]
MKPPTEMDLKNIPDNFLAVVAHIALGMQSSEHNGSSAVDYSSPILKPVVARIYPVFIIMYALPAALGIATNVLMVMYISKYKLYKDATHAFVVNLAFCHTVQCAFVLPITLMVMLIQNWVFGQFMCFFLPLLQDIPLHVAMFSHLLIAWDRKRWLKDPLKARLPAFVCSCASWLAGMVIALPYPIYTTYIDLGKYVPKLDGVGICAMNLMDDMQEYNRGLFVLMYCGPMTLLGYLYIRTARELRPPDGPLSIMMFEARSEARSKQIRSGRGSASAGSGNISASSRTYDLYDAELDVNREKRTQRHLGAMASTQVLCVCPLMILRLAKMTVNETYDNEAHFDITYLLFVWIAFLPTVIVPWIYGSWVLSRPAKERLRGYLRLSSRRNTGTKSVQSLDGGISPSGNSDMKTPLSTTNNSALSNPTPTAPPAASILSTSTNSSATKSSSNTVKPAHSDKEVGKPASVSSVASTNTFVHRPKQLPTIDHRSKSPAGGSTKTQQSILESSLAESTISSTATKPPSTGGTGRPRRQLPPPIRIENSNFNKTPSVRSRASSDTNNTLRSSLRSTTSSRISAANVVEQRVAIQPSIPRRTSLERTVPDDDEDDYCSSIAGNCSNITSSTYCNINEREVVAPDLYESLPAERNSRQSLIHKSASPYYQPTDQNNDLDSDSDIYQRRPATRYGSLSQQDSTTGILKATPSIISVSESEYSSRKGSLSTLSRDMEIIDRLERERSMDIQEMIQREKTYEYYLSRQNSKLKFSTNFDDYFEEEPTQTGSSLQKQRSTSPHVTRNPPARRSSNQSYSSKRDSGYEDTSCPASAALQAQQQHTPVGSIGHGSGPYSASVGGPRRSIDLEQKQRFNRTYSGSSARSSTKSRDRVSFHDDI